VDSLELFLYIYLYQNDVRSLFLQSISIKYNNFHNGMW